MATHKGSCHCGAVQIEVDAPSDITADECNCSVCQRIGYLHLIVNKDAFRLTAGADALTTYQFGTKTAHHLFCSTCGVKAHYIPRSHPDGISVNVRCLDPATIGTLTVRPFDGQNWEQNVEELRRKT